MRYNIIRKMDIANGPGIRVSIFMQGCTFNCKNCFNKETHDFNGGKEFTDDTISKVLDLASESYIQGLSILGGEPLNDENMHIVSEIIKKLQNRIPELIVYIWTGYTYEELVARKSSEINWILSRIATLVDGRFDITQRNSALKMRGSANQRIIDLTISDNNDIIFINREKGEKHDC